MQSFPSHGTGGLGFEQRVAEARRARLEAVAGSAGPLPDYPELATGIPWLPDLNIVSMCQMPNFQFFQR